MTDPSSDEPTAPIPPAEPTAPIPDAEPTLPVPGTEPTAPVPPAEPTLPVPAPPPGPPAAAVQPGWGAPPAGWGAPPPGWGGPPVYPAPWPAYAPAPWPPGYPPAIPSPQASNPLAVWSLVLGIVGASGALCCVLFGLCAPAAIITGHLGKQRADQSYGRIGGRGLAQAGFVLGIVGSAVFAIQLVILVVFALTGG